MNITWTSRQGQNRQTNKDAVALGYCQQYLVIVLADAAETTAKVRPMAGMSNPRKPLAQYWADSCMGEIVTQAACNSEETLIELLHNNQKSLRQHYLHEIASYGVLVLDANLQSFTWWFTGDCRLGIQPDQNQITWLGQPHRLENSPLWHRQTALAADDPEIRQAAKHQLTQSLNARRFVRPEKISAQLSPNESIVIATDGYWCEHVFNGVAFTSLEDDASVLTIKPGKRVLNLETDTPNLLVMYR